MSNEKETYELDVELETEEQKKATEIQPEPEDGKKAGEKFYTEAEVQKYASQMAENQLMRLAIDDPEFAEYLRSKMTGKQKAQSEQKPVEPKQEKKSSGKSEKDSEEVERLRKELENIRLSQEQKYQEMEWKGSVEKLDDFFESDSFFSKMPDDLQIKMKNTMVRSFHQARQAGDKQSEKSFFNLFKKDIESLAGYSVTQWRQARKQANSIPVSPKEIQSSIQKHRGDYQPSGKDLKEGKLKEKIKELMKNIK